ncbi:MAG: hypothetical protein P4L87_19015 [Formivibrio sp.]|nr:hypothetical protein [Formivibrio sp.]
MTKLLTNMQDFALCLEGLFCYALILNILHEIYFGISIARELASQHWIGDGAEDLICMVGSNQGPSLSLQCPRQLVALNFQSIAGRIDAIAALSLRSPN